MQNAGRFCVDHIFSRENNPSGRDKPRVTLFTLVQEAGCTMGAQLCLMNSAGAAYTDPAISTTNGEEHGGALKMET